MKSLKSLALATALLNLAGTASAEMSDSQLAEVRGQGFVLSIELPFIGTRDLVEIPTLRDVALGTGIPQAYGDLNQTYIATQPNRDAARAGRQAVADARNQFLATGLNAIVGLELPVGIRFE
jgi:hypothetical protein